MANYTYLTQEGHDRLKGELDELKTNGRQDAARAIAEARDKGDLSENAEYDAAKNHQGYLEARINELEKIMMNARVLDLSSVDTSKVSIFTTVRMKNMKMNKEVTYKLVSENEANTKESKISVTSPIGKGLLGKVVGEIAQVTIPAGMLEFEILEISA